MTPLRAAFVDHFGVYFPPLPLWRGVSKFSKEGEKIPFALGLTPSGYVRQVNDTAVIEEVVRQYSQNNYRFITPPPGTSAWGTFLGEQKLSTVEQMVGELSGTRILEIGGGTTYLAEAFVQRHEIELYVCIDPALITGDVQNHSRIECIKRYFPSEELRGRKFDLIMANSCIEHISDAIVFLRSMSDHLSETGVAFLTFPDVSRGFEDGDLNVLLHEHINYFDQATAYQLFSLTGFEVVRWESRNDLASCLVKRRAVSEESVEPEAGVNLIKSAIEGFSLHLMRRAIPILEDLKHDAKIVFYGATNGLACFFALADSDGLRNCTIVDGDRNKAGTYLPMSSYKIKAADEMDFGSVDEVVVSAASFETEIRRSLSDVYGVSSNMIRSLFRENCHVK
jgi:2-polyprenyl-3-methyl-5-hydroxy-6-metoxy-1,4-benzoquinol methylase